MSATNQDEPMIAADLWMLTLSDLLLLLLSMFVMMLSMADLSGGAFKKKLPVVTEQPETEPVRSSNRTVLASLSALRDTKDSSRGGFRERPELFSVSLAHSFTAEGNELTFDAVEVLMAVARTVKEGRLGVTVELFLPHLPAGTDGEEQQRIIERAGVVIRQLIDAGVEREALTTRVSVTPMTPDQASEQKGSGGLRVYLLSREQRSAP